MRCTSRMCAIAAALTACSVLATLVPRLARATALIREQTDYSSRGGAAEAAAQRHAEAAEQLFAALPTDRTEQFEHAYWVQSRFPDGAAAPWDVGREDD